jgi:hypothetical protein
MDYLDRWVKLLVLRHILPAKTPIPLIPSIAREHIRWLLDSMTWGGLDRMLEVDPE